jgi:hypothetical protein
VLGGAVASALLRKSGPVRSRRRRANVGHFGAALEELSSLSCVEVVATIAIASEWITYGYGVSPAGRPREQDRTVPLGSNPCPPDVCQTQDQSALTNVGYMHAALTLFVSPFSFDLSYVCINMPICTCSLLSPSHYRAQSERWRAEMKEKSDDQRGLFFLRPIRLRAARRTNGSIGSAPNFLLPDAPSAGFVFH